MGPFGYSVHVPLESLPDRALQHAARFRGDPLAILLVWAARAMGGRRVRLRPDAAGAVREVARLESPGPGNPRQRGAAAVSRRPARRPAARLLRPAQSAAATGGSQTGG